MTIRAFDVAASRPWLILPDSLQQIMAIADRLGDPKSEAVVEALATRQGRPLDGASSVDKRPNGVAVVSITGPIFRYANLFTEFSGAMSTQLLARDIQTAVDDPLVRAVVLNIDSPGGEAAGISEMAEMIYAARKKKPMWAYIGDTGASAAYWLASAAERVVARDFAVLGSIGVVMSYLDTSERDSRSGVRRMEIVSSNAPSKRPDPKTEAGRAKVQATVDALADVFVAAVAKQRGVDTAKVLKDFGQGGVKVGQQAVDAGMADELGSLEAVIEMAGSGKPIPPKQEKRSMKGNVTVSNTADLRTALEAGYAAENIQIAAGPDVEKIKAEARAEGVAAGKTEGKSEAEKASAATTDAAVKSAVDAERKRCGALLGLSSAKLEPALVKAIDEGTTAEATALALVKDAKDKGVTLAGIQADATRAKPEPNGNGKPGAWDRTITNHGGKP